MNNGILIFIGLLLTMLWSWYGFIVQNIKQVGRQEPAKLMTGETFPTGRSGTAQFGQEVYRANGCASCHTMQVRPQGHGADIERGWGKRNTVLRDFVHDEHVFLGQTRIGPDLAGIGTRPYATREWHLAHLWNPRTVVKNSLMPQYPYLFKVRKMLGGRPSPEALSVAPEFRKNVPEGYEIVPSREAIALVEYLTSLQSDVRLLEAPIITNAPSGNVSQQAAPTGVVAPTNQ
jgi:cytochrome c oxidase cbb3-type subunit 2